MSKPTKQQTFGELLEDMFIGHEYKEQMNMLAEALDYVFNKDQRPKKNCFVLLVAPFDDADGAGSGGRVNYISNGKRADIISLMKEYIARAEALP